MAQSAALALIFVVLLMAPMVFSREYDDSHDYYKKPKEKEFTVYLYACTKGPKTNSFAVAGIPGRPREPTEFGTLYVGDLLVTKDISPYSKEIGRSQGMQAITSHDGSTQYNTFSIIFTKGEYTGSTLEMQGISKPAGKFEFSVPSGTKDFRYASGYATGEVVRRKKECFVTKLAVVIKYDYPKKPYYKGVTEENQT